MEDERKCKAHSLEPPKSTIKGDFSCKLKDVSRMVLKVTGGILGGV